MFILFPSSFSPLKIIIAFFCFVENHLIFWLSLASIFRAFFFISHTLSPPTEFLHLVSFFLLCTFHIFIWKYPLWFSSPLSRQLFTFKWAFCTLGNSSQIYSLVTGHSEKCFLQWRGRLHFIKQPAKKATWFWGMKLTKQKLRVEIIWENQTVTVNFNISYQD